MKRITATLILAALLVSCGGGKTDPAVTTAGTTAAGTTATATTAATTAETTVTTTVETTAETTVATTAATETTTETAVMTTAETESVTTEAVLALPEFDINSEECLMYRLLDMTVEEIEAEFGELELYGIIAGGTPCYEIPEYGILLYFEMYSEDFYEPLPKDMKPWLSETDGYDRVIYPGVYVGMDSKELIDKFGIEHLQFSMGEIRGGFTSTYRVNEKYFWVRWELPENVMLNIEYTALNCDGNEYDTLIEEVISKMRSGEIRGEVLDVGVA